MGIFLFGFIAGALTIIFVGALLNDEDNYGSFN